MIRKSIIAMLTLTSLGCLLAACFLGRFPTRSFCRVLRTDSLYVEAMIISGVLSVGITHCNDPSVFDGFDELLARVKASHQSGRGLKVPGPLLRFELEWRTDLSASSGVPLDISTIAFPLVIPTIVFAAYPMFAFMRGPLRRYRRRKRGLCIRCGYNLEGNVSGLCSECGETR